MPGSSPWADADAGGRECKAEAGFRETTVPQGTQAKGGGNSKSRAMRTIYSASSSHGLARHIINGHKVRKEGAL